MKFMEILQTLARTTVEHHPELIPLVLAARVELFRLTQLKAGLEGPDMVFERWALPPNRGVKHELENSKTLKYGDIHLNAAHIGFMQCYTWLQPRIELQVKTSEGTNTPDVLQNDKKTFSEMLKERIESDGFFEFPRTVKYIAVGNFEFSMRNNLDPCQHTAIKYIARFRQKGGIADLDKAIHTIELLKHFESTK